MASVLYLMVVECAALSLISIFFSISFCFKRELIKSVCKERPSWSAHTRGDVVVLAGAKGFHVQDIGYLPPIPSVALDKVPPTCADQE